MRDHATGGSRLSAFCWIARLFAVAGFVACTGPVHAADLWCAVIDGSNHRVFVSDLTTRPNFTKFETWRLSARFVAAVNGRYSTRFRGSGDACRTGSATTLSVFRGDMARLGYALIVVGVY